MSHERIVFEAEADRQTGEVKPAFNIVIVYDSRQAVTRAMNALSGLICQFDDDFEFHCDLWRFDVLELPEVFAAAVGTGIAANLIIVAARCDTDLPLPVKAWLNQCADGKTPGSAALVALLESHQWLSDVQGGTRQLLQSAAARGGLDFFLLEVALEEPANAVLSVREGILCRREPPMHSIIQE